MIAGKRLSYPLAGLLLFLLVLPARAGNEMMIYSETAAFVHWINVAPDVELSPENTPRNFTAVVREAGKLQGFGLPVHIADRVNITLVAPYTWRVEKDGQSVDIDTHNKIHFSNYPKFQ